MPQEMTPHVGLYFLDNEGLSHTFDGVMWVTTLDEGLTEMPTELGFVVLPDVPGDAEANIEKHCKWFWTNYCHSALARSERPVQEVRGPQGW